MNNAEQLNSDESITINPPPVALWRRVIGPFGDLLLPPFCPVCHERMNEDDQAVCSPCRRDMTIVKSPRCPICGAKRGLVVIDY